MWPMLGPAPDPERATAAQGRDTKVSEKLSWGRNAVCPLHECSVQNAGLAKEFLFCVETVQPETNSAYQKVLQITMVARGLRVFLVCSGARSVGGAL